MATLVFASIVGLAALALTLLSRQGRPSLERSDVGADGIVLSSGSRTLTWASISQITLLTHPNRYRGRTEFAFVVEGDGGTRCGLSSRTGAAQRLLAEAHRLPGFEQQSVVEHLASPRPVEHRCYTRSTA